MQVYRPNIFNEHIRNDKLLWLDKNENINENLLKFIKKKTTLTKEIISAYPNLSTTYIKLANFYNVNKYSLLLSHGSDGGIQNVFQALIKKNNLVILSSPTFAMYDVYSKAFDAKITYIKYIHNQKGKISLDLNSLFKVLKKKPKLLCLPNPDSPTGSIINEKTLNQIIKLCNKIGCYILIDEAYHLYYEKSQIKKINQYKNLIIVKSFSKAFGLAGLRAGCLISNIETIKYLKSFKPMYEINHFCAEVLNTILTKKGIEIVKRSINETKKGKNFFIQFIKKKKLKFLDSHGNFIHVNFGDHRKEIINELKKICYFRENDVLLPIEGYSRFTLTNIKNFKKITNIINRYI